MWKSRAGSVSLSLILIIAPLFTFHTTLIDAARVRMGERQAEAATKTALRSVLSAYDPSLQGYGLFAVGHSPEASAALFSQVLRENLDPGGTGAFTLVEPAPVAESLKPTYTLGNRSVFQRQVLEEMKYRAPVEFALSVTDKLKNKSNATAMMAGVSQFSQQAQKAEQLMAERDGELDAAWSAAQQMAEKASVFGGYYAKKLQRLDELCALIGFRDAEDIKRSIQSLKTQADGLRKAIAERQAGLAGLLQAGAQAAEQVAAIQQSINDLERSWSELNGQIGELEQILQYIAEYTLLMNTTKLEAKRDRETLTEMAADVFGRLDRAKALDDQIRSETPTLPAGSDIAPEAWSALTNPDSYYMAYKTGIGGIGALFNGFEAAMDATTLLLGDNRFDAERMQLLSASNDAYVQKAALFIGEQRVEEQKRTAAGENVNRRKKEQKQLFANIWDQARKIWADCGDGADEPYKRLEIGDPAAGELPLFQKYMDYNRIEPTVAYESGDMGNADETVKSTPGTIDRLLNGIASATGEFRDELYINEYALTKFNYRTYGKETGPDGKAKPDYELSQRAGHVLPGQEAEYLLYGLNSCLKNQSAAYTEMYALRLIVRTAEALMEPEAKIVTAGNPVLTLLWALAEGAARAFADMTKLVNGEEVPITAKTPPTLTLNYKDYLRLFLLLHTKRDPMTARLQSLVELNTGRDLREAAVQLQARTDTNLRLWFMPYTLAAIGYPVDDNQARLSKTASLSY